ncbi:SDR family NAD(P)-dependent oxidoreductase [Streptomyces ipomoeae]|uniref:SDR family NAD(P)-dependent oxidoreductase n=1 Tax=Streptomyces ipomoeae TaxID=103232 RepID=UPI001146F6C1|nr:SDR family oxidoreductase [Streptomyces ipomoeae]MDX2935515.1 SDR family oxidoreductase [Streptomyces ipomoeae]TQE18346.1 SDR family oxidoreductase [Streptomyces ipomoeae]
MSNRLNGKVAIVTGGARGQGRATAELFADEGAIVYACDVDAGDYSHHGVRHRQMDITSESGWAAIVNEAREENSRIDVLVNNAAVVLSDENIVDAALGDIETVLRVNTLGATLGVRAVIPAMLESGGGSIVNIVSTVAQHASPVHGAYQLSKGGVRSLTRHIAVTYARLGIRANSVLPGLVDTRMLAESPDEAMEAAAAGIPMGRLARPIEIAYGSLFLASDESSYMTGSELVIDGGILA